MKAIIQRNGQSVTLDNVDLIPQGINYSTPWFGIVTGSIKYTVEDLGQGLCKLRTYEKFIPVRANEELLELEYGSDGILLLGDRLV